VYLAEKLGQLFQERFAQVQVRHRELGSELLKGRT
jgi:RNase adaptor protein for sRNA GlmZ degradation